MVQILSTKLFAPELNENHVPRSLLLEKILAGIGKRAKLTLISAPAGYGKTTLALEVLSEAKRRTDPSQKYLCAYISLDESDNDLIQFITYLIAALRRADPGVLQSSISEESSGDFGLASANALLTMIINDIARYPDKIILVLDDFHFINSPQVCDAVKFLLEHQPQSLHLIIAAREDPRLPLSSLRVRRELIEVRLDELCFSSPEVQEFFQKVMELNLSEEALRIIASRTEGWVAGLQLAGLSLNNYTGDDIEEYVRIFGETHRYIIDYLVEEVISRQSGEVQDFLCRTSVLGRMNGELCNELTGGKEGRRLLTELEKSNLFLIPLDNKREWYRYHQLFADSLRMELTREEEQHLHRKAAIWLENNGFKLEAVKHAFSSGDMQLAQRLVEDNTEQAFANAQLTTLLKWMNMLPAELVTGSHILSVRKAWALYITGKAEDAMDYIRSLGEEFFKNTTPHNKGLYLSLKASIGQLAGRNEEAGRLAEEALTFLESWDPIARVSTTNTLGRAQLNTGRASEACSTFSRAYAEGKKLGYTFVTTLALMNLGNSLNALDRRQEAIGLFNEYIDGMTAKYGKPLPFIGVIYVSIAGLYLQENELQKAKFYIGKGTELCRSISYNWILHCEELQARIDKAIEEAGEGAGASAGEGGEGEGIKAPEVGEAREAREEREAREAREEREEREAGMTGKAEETGDACKAEDAKKIAEGSDPSAKIAKGSDPAAKFGMTQREVEILQLIGKGMSNSEISKALYISGNTTQWHISHILSKLEVKNRTQAILKAKEAGII